MANVYTILYLYNIVYARIFIGKNGRVSAQTMASLCTVDQTILLLLLYTVIQVQLPLTLFLFSFYFLVLVLCFPIVPMGVSIPLVDISQDTRIEIHLAFALELLPELIPFVIMRAHTHTHPPPLFGVIPLIIQATLFISLLRLSIMADGRALVSFLNDTDIILTLFIYFFF